MALFGNAVISHLLDSDCYSVYQHRCPFVHALVTDGYGSSDLLIFLIVVAEII